MRLLRVTSVRCPEVTVVSIDLILKYVVIRLMYTERHYHPPIEDP